MEENKQSVFVWLTQHLFASKLRWIAHMIRRACKNTEYIHVYYYWKQTFGRQSRKLNTLNHQMVHLQKLWHFLKINKLGWKVNNKDCIFFFNLSNLNLLMRNLISGCWKIWWRVTWPHLNKKSKERRGPWCSEVLTLLGYINWGEWLSLIFEWNLIYCTLFCYASCY